MVCTQVCTQLHLIIGTVLVSLVDYVHLTIPALSLGQLPWLLRKGTAG
jgi:hypothetical protein